MKHKLFFLAFYLIHICVNAAQHDSINVHEFTDAQCVEFALTHSIELKNSSLDVKIQEAQNKEYIGMSLPQLKANANTTRFIDIPANYFPDVFTYPVTAALNSFGVKDGNGNVIQPQQGNAGGSFVKFGQNWNAGMGLSLSQLIFEPNVLISIIATKELLKLANTTEQISQEKIRENVLKLYYNYLLLQKKNDLMLNTISRVKQLLNETDKAYQSGFREKLDVDRIKVTLANINIAHEQLKNASIVLNLTLKYLIGMNLKDSLILKSPLQESITNVNLENSSQSNYSNRADYKQLEIGKTLRQIDVRRNKLAFLPTITGSFDYNYNSVSNEFVNLYGKSNAFNSSYINVNISLPIFKGFSQRNRLNQAKFQLQKIENTIENSKAGMDMEESIAKTNYITALQNLDIQKSNIVLAKEVYEITKKKFNEGLSLSFELLDANNQLNATEANYYDALSQLVNAKIMFKKALGQLTNSIID